MGPLLRGYTIVEVLVVVVVIGVLAVLGYYGVRRYLAAVKAAEAKQNVGDISRAAHAAYERELMPSQQVPEGTNSTVASHVLCGSATPVPATVPVGTKYQARTSPGQDFQSGSATAGWRCLHFYIHTPMHHQYHYTKDGGPVAAGSPVECTSNCYEAAALGDLDGDGLFSRIARTGQINTATGELLASTQVHVENEEE